MDRALMPLAALLAVAAAQYAWNVARVSPFSGFDVAGHIAYILTILREGRLPLPYSGWVNFHPPLYYMLGAGAWRVLEPLGAHAIVVGLRAIGAVAWLAAGAASYRLCRRLGASKFAAWTASALVLFTPCAQLTAVAARNEALSAAFSSGGLWFLLDLQENPRNINAAAAAGLCAGLALIAKYTGIWLAGACLIPFLRRPWRRGSAHAAAAGLLVAGALAAPVYWRNIALSGTPFPLMKNTEPVKSVDALFVLRPRHTVDFLWLDPRCLWHPSLFLGDDFDPRMANVPGLTYAGAWYDPFQQRIAPADQEHGLPWGRLLAVLGLLPTSLALWGFLRALRRAARSGLADQRTPLAGMTLLGLVNYLAFVATTPSATAVKANYLLPLALPLAVFFCDGAAALAKKTRPWALGASAAAAFTAALVFTHGVIFDAFPNERALAAALYTANLLPGAHMDEAAGFLRAAAMELHSNARSIK